MKVSNKSKRNILMFPVVLSTVILAYVAFFICIVLPNTAISLILAYGAVIVGGFAIIVGLLSMMSSERAGDDKMEELKKQTELLREQAAILKEQNKLLACLKLMTSGKKCDY